ncbi:MAG TPA: heavy metal translocating P-type ATPase, partial [Thiolinea sp.]|nr:heavy metal translocating P-type ATPase [Thiolinea sp.]
KQPGDRLVGGTLNMSSPLLLQLDRVGADTVLAGITRLLDRAQAEKPALARLADRVASWFVLFILLLAAAVYGWWHFHDPEQAFWITLSVLVVTCPCALSLATPAAITVATGRLTGLGVLTTRGHALETLARVDQLVFDKTGTLTHGELVVADLQVAKGQEPLQCRNLAAGLEQASEHPLARALLAFGPEPLPLTDLMSQPGQGVEGRYQGQRVRLGTRDFVAALAGDGMALAADAADFPGATAVFLGTGQQWLAVFHLRDRVRDEADAVVRELGKMGVKVHLLSGDNEGAVAHLAGMLHIRSFQARQLPDTKLAFVRTLQEQGAVVAMVGDGVNDAPVLAQAQVSLAMGQGAQLAQASADMILLSENLALLPVSVRLARRMQAVIRQNLFWALGYNLLAIPLAASGMLPPWMAALGMSASSLLVVANALRLRNG